MHINKDNDSLVVIKNKGSFYWFCSFKEMWVLDRVKWFNDFLKNGIDVLDANDHRERYDIGIVDSENCDEFIKLLKLDDFEVNKEDLSKEFHGMDLKNKKWWDVYGFFPDVYIDFDSKVLYSQYVENMHYENYVPEGWLGELKDFCNENILPSSECFWIKDGVDYRRAILEKE